MAFILAGWGWEFLLILYVRLMSQSLILPVHLCLAFFSLRMASCASIAAVEFFQKSLVEEYALNHIGILILILGYIP